MSIYGTFKDRNEINTSAKTQLNSRFIFEGNSAVEITVGTEILNAAIVNKQERDMCYLYLMIEDKLTSGTLFSWNDLHFILLEEIKYTKTVDFVKYTCLKCNVEIGTGVWGYFKSAQQQYISTIIKDGNTELSKQEPILVTTAGALSYEDKIVFNGRPWLVIEEDITSTSGIGYYSLKPTTLPKEADENTLIVGDTKTLSNDIVVNPLETITLTTENGFFTHSKKLLNISCQSKEVSFKIPFGLKSFSVEVKEKGAVKKYAYKVEI